MDNAGTTIESDASSGDDKFNEKLKAASSSDSKLIEQFYDVCGKFYLKGMGDNESIDLQSKTEGKFLMKDLREAFFAKNNEAENKIKDTKSKMKRGGGEDNEFSSDYYYCVAANPNAPLNYKLSQEWTTTFDVYNYEKDSDVPILTNLVSKKTGEDDHNGLVFNYDEKEVKILVNLTNDSNNKLDGNKMTCQIFSLDLLVSKDDENNIKKFALTDATVEKISNEVYKEVKDKDGNSLSYASSGILNFENFIIRSLDNSDIKQIKYNTVSDMISEDLSEFEKDVLRLLQRNNLIRNKNELLGILGNANANDTLKQQAIVHFFTQSNEFTKIFERQVKDALEKVLPRLFQQIDEGVKNYNKQDTHPSENADSQQGGRMRRNHTRATKRRSGRRSSRKQRRSQRKRNAKRNSRR